MSSDQTINGGPPKSAWGARWEGRGGWREVLVVSFPLILSHAAWSLQHFIDRMFLAWYAPEAIAAAMPAGILQFALMSIFLGTAGYASTFAAQYHGAGRPESIGPSVWQGVHLSILGGLAIMATAPLAPGFFAWVGHPPLVREYETVYYAILCWGAVPAIATAPLGGYFSGQGRTWPVMVSIVLAMGVNIILDYGLIFGHWGLPRMGVAGAAVATNLASLTSCLFYLLWMARREYRVRAPFFRRWRPDRDLMGRLLKFGFPAGMQFFVDIAGFAAFLLLVGRLGTEPLAATTIALNINAIAFMPMLGFGIGISVLVGQAQGEGRPDLAERATWSGFHLTFAYVGSVALLYAFVPGPFVRPFAGDDPAAFEAVRVQAVVLLRFVAAYCLFDALNIVFSAALKGAGDTLFITKVIAALSAGVLVVPTAAAVLWLGAGLYAVWAIATLYVCLLGTAFLLRFRHGRWKGMRVIEEAPEIVDVPVH